MTLLLDSLAVGAADPLYVRVETGRWATVAHAHPSTVLDVVAGLRPGVGGIVLHGRELSGLGPAERVRHGLATVTSRLPDLPGVSLLEVVQLARPTSTGTQLWSALAGTAFARGRLADAEAAARALAGRMGLSPWLSREAVRLPGTVSALADAVRALAGGPAGLVWRRPEWLPDADAADIAEAIAVEHERLDLTVVELIGDQGQMAKR